jgi:P-type Cu2+ transporter
MDHSTHNHTQGGQPMADVAMADILPETETMRHTDDARAMGYRDHATMGHTGKKMSHSHHDMSDPAMAGAMAVDMRNRFFLSLLLTIPTVLYSDIGMHIFGLNLPHPLRLDLWLFLLSTPVVLWGGWVFHSGAWEALKARTLNMSVLVSFGVLVSYLFSVGVTLTGGGDTYYDAGAMLVTFVLFGHWMEMRSRQGSSEALRALLDLAPPMATVLRGGQPIEIPTAEVKVGDLLLLRPGAKVPVDGEVTESETTIDESLITGESLPVTKRVGDAVVGGSINRTGSVTFQATKVGSNTALAQIVELVRTAQNSKAPAQRLADWAAQWLVVLAVSAGVTTFLLWYFVGGESVRVALTFAVSAIVIACPDALGLATPTAVAVATGLGAGHGILFKQAAAIEQSAKLTTVVFDKTGTLTIGKPSVTDILTNGVLSDDDLLALTASAETRSEHPLAAPIVETARARHLTVSESAHFDAITGAGVVATVAGHRVLVGNPRLMNEYSISFDGLRERADRLAQDGKTPLFVAVDGRPAGVIAAADTVRPEAKQAVEDLHAIGVKTVMITGDNQRTAEAIAKLIGIDEVQAEVRPEDKAMAVTALQRAGQVVAMVGDGVNDAPALAQADLGIAIGAGTDVAIETADIVLTRSNPGDVAAAIKLGRATVRKMKQNLFWAAIYNLLAIPVAAGVLYKPLGIELQPAFAALAMSASSITVATNAVLLRRERGKLGLDRNAA